jgi:hypothetical protein
MYFFIVRVVEGGIKKVFRFKNQQGGILYKQLLINDILKNEKQKGVLKKK